MSEELETLAEMESQLGFGGEVTDPKWEEAGRVHDWRNYICEELRAIWHTFTNEQQITIAFNAQGQASDENWD